jgi:nucleoside-diphosphate-sugar epimerase
MMHAPKAHSPRRLLIVGFGDVASRLTRQLQGQTSAWHIAALVRSPAGRARAERYGIRIFDGDLARQETLQRASAWPDAIVHLAPPPNSGTTDPHTQHLLSALGRRGHSQPPIRLVYVSTTGVYGDAAGAVVDETTPVQPGTPRAIRRCDAERRLRQAASRDLIHLTVLRAPGIYAHDRLPLERLKAGTAALIASQDMWTNHIHADDLAAMIRRTLFSSRNSRVYNAVDYSQLKMADYFDLVADHFALPRPPRLDRIALATQVSPMMLSFMSESRRMLPTRIAKECHFKHLFPTVSHTLASLT